MTKHNEDETTLLEALAELDKLKATTTIAHRLLTYQLLEIRSNSSISTNHEGCSDCKCKKQVEQA